MIIITPGRAFERNPVLAAVHRLHRDRGRHDQNIRISRINDRIWQITPTDSRSGTSVVGDLGPRLARVVAAVDAHGGRWSVGCYRRVQPLRVARRDRQVHLIDGRGKTVGERLPRLAAVGGFEKTTTASRPRRVLPRTLALLPEVRVDDLRIIRVDVDVVAAGVLVALENGLERLSAVEAAVDAAFPARSIRVAEDGDEDPERIDRIDGDHRDLLRVVQAEVRPRFAGIVGLVHAVTDGEVGARESLAAAYIYGIGIRGGDGDRADRLRGLVIEDWLPGASRVGGFPDAAVHLRHVEGVRLIGDTGSGARASAAQWSDPAPVQRGRGSRYLLACEVRGDCEKNEACARHS